jgi:glycosyltransferase involved in cell wall biosynthesis
MEIATRSLLRELRRARFPYARVNTADPDDELGNRARWTRHNVYLAFRHLASATFQSFRRDTAAVYVPIAQEFPALFRDLAFVAIAHVARKPVVLHLHGGNLASFYESRSRLVKRLMRGTLGRAALGIVLSDPLRPEFECLLPSERVVAVPNGIDLPTEGARERRRKEHEVNVLFLSSLYRWKGILLFVEAFAAAHARRPFLRAVAAGPWPSEQDRRETLALVQRLGIASSLLFTGTVDTEEKSRVLAEADIFCFPSLVPEGQGLVVLEAMASSLPVVAIGWPGVADTVRDGETGLLVADASPELLADRLVYLADHPEERERLGTAGRRRYEKLYTQAAFGQRMIRVLRPFLQPSALDLPPDTSGVAT